MDNTPAPAQTRRFGPDRRLTSLTAVLALGCLIAVFAGNDPAGRLLLAIAAFILAAYTVSDLLYWPRLSIEAAGLYIRTPAVRGQFGWDAVAAVKSDVRQRAGLRSVTLEIDLEDTIVVFSRRMLGADPDFVASVLRAYDPRR